MNITENDKAELLVLLKKFNAFVKYGVVNLEFVDGVLKFIEKNERTKVD